MGIKMKALRAAFPHTIPVLTGYAFLGAAYGILMQVNGFGLGWAVLMSIITYSGSMQYLAVTLLTSAFNPLYALMLTLMVNARHLFYGVSMLERLRGTGAIKPYLIGAMTDETFSILCSVQPPKGVDRRWFMFFVTLLDHSYWILASAVGSIVGTLVTFDTRGLDFVLTALFVVIFLNQWKADKKYAPALIGLGCSIFCLVLFGPGNMIITSMLCIFLVLAIFRSRLEKGVDR